MTKLEKRSVLRNMVTPRPDNASRAAQPLASCWRILKNSVGPSTMARPRPPHMPPNTTCESTTPKSLTRGAPLARIASRPRSLQPNCADRMNVPPTTSGTEPLYNPRSNPDSATTRRAASTEPPPLDWTTVLTVSNGCPTATVVRPYAAPDANVMPVSTKSCDASVDARRFGAAASSGGAMGVRDRRPQTRCADVGARSRSLSSRRTVTRERPRLYT
mmetsp:Transcript_20398/g.64182  ORF Transcript_20398/g.64182 Transcript_20398/m.64182 type:complete len:217 (-) Transcript_20398:194-844(-)